MGVKRRRWIQKKKKKKKTFSSCRAGKDRLFGIGYGDLEKVIL